jgi:hypothetical protein
MALMTSEEAAVQIGRAKNAVLDFFEKKLSVPKIYLDAEWAGQRVDLLIIDRDGAGEVTVLRLYLRSSFLDKAKEGEHLDTLVEELKAIPAQFKYVVAVEDISVIASSDLILSPHFPAFSFSPDGLGRVGLIRAYLANDEFRVEIGVRAERFKAYIAKLADEYMQQHLPDWEMRP